MPNEFSPFVGWRESGKPCSRPLGANSWTLYGTLESSGLVAWEAPWNFVEYDITLRKLYKTDLTELVGVVGGRHGEVLVLK